MKLRTQLILAFLLLAVAPLSGLTLFSYLSSQRALLKAVEAESTEAAGQMSRRMEAVSEDLGMRFDQLGDLPFGNWLEVAEASEAAEAAAADAASDRIYSRVVSALGDTVGLVESLELAPPPKPPGAVDAKGSSVPEPPPPRLVFRLPKEPPAAPTPRPGVGRDASRSHSPPRPRVVHSGDVTIVLAPPEPGAAPKSGLDLRMEIEEGLREAKAASESHRKAAQAAAAAARSSAAEAAAPAAESREETFNIVLGGPLADRAHRSRGRIRAELNPEKVFQRVVGPVPAARMWSAAEAREVPFAVDPQGNLFTPRPEDRKLLEGLGLEQLAADGRPSRLAGGWVVVAQKDPASDLTLGIARPIALPLAEIRNAALRNLTVGLGLIGLALVGILPLSNRITRNVKTLSRGAEKLAAGDLKARVPVRSGDELGRLAETFNRMAQDLERHQSQVVQQQRLQKELELCRHIQEEMLPKRSLRVPLAEVKGVSIPAREVGGDFFNYFPVEPGRLAIVIGDVSGKGVAAALLMANVQATLKARLPLAGGLGELASQLDEEIAGQTPPQTYLTLFMATLDLRRGTLRWVNAGHNPQYALGRDGSFRRLESGGRPLGLLPGGGFDEGVALLREGDSLFLYTDGLTEAADRFGTEFGQQRLEEILAREAGRDLNALLKLVETAVHQHREGSDPGDDATMVALKFGAAEA